MVVECLIIVIEILIAEDVVMSWGSFVEYILSDDFDAIQEPYHNRDLGGENGE